MLKKTITYETFDEEKVTEDFYFNLTKAELAKWNYTTVGGLQKLMEKISNTRDIPELFSLFEKIIDMAYGERSDDGKRFMKSEERTTAFKETNAYNDMFMEFIEDPNKYVEFLKAIVPSDIAEEMNKQPQA